MWPLAQAFVDIALHRRGPEHLPASRFLLVLVALAYLSVGLVSLQIGEPLQRAATLLAVDTVLYLAFARLLLHLFNRPGRFLQTATALLGTETLLNILGLPLLVWLGSNPSPETAALLPALLFFSLFLWSVDISGFILARALDRTYVLGVMIVITYVLGSMTLRDLLFPANG